MLREQRVYIIEGLMTESFFDTKSEPLSEQDAKRLKDYLIKVKKSINEKESSNKNLLRFNSSDKSFEKKINKYIEKAKKGKYGKGVTVFNDLSTKFISFKEKITHSKEWQLNQIINHYEINKLINMNPCKDKFRLKLIKTTHYCNGVETGFSFSLELSSIV